MADRIKRPRGVKRTHHPWTPEQLATLVREWNEVGARTLLAKLRPHTWTAIRLRASALGLAALPQGLVSISRLAERFGVSRDLLQLIVSRASVRVRSTYPNRYPPHVRRLVSWHLVDEFDARKAFEAWLRRETPQEASARTGVASHTLWLRARHAGLVVPRRRTRLEPAQWDVLANVRPYARVADYAAAAKAVAA